MDPHIWTIIAKHSDFRGVVTIRSLCRRIRQLVFHLTIPYWVKVNDTILKLYLTNFQHLDASHNRNITNVGIKGLTNLQGLYAYDNPNITDIKHLTNLQLFNGNRVKKN